MRLRSLKRRIASSHVACNCERTRDGAIQPTTARLMRRRMSCDAASCSAVAAAATLSFTLDRSARITAVRSASAVPDRRQRRVTALTTLLARIVCRRQARMPRWVACDARIRLASDAITFASTTDRHNPIAPRDSRRRRAAERRLAALVTPRRLAPVRAQRESAAAERDASSPAEAARDASDKRMRR